MFLFFVLFSFRSSVAFLLTCSDHIESLLPQFLTDTFRATKSCAVLPRWRFLCLGGYSLRGTTISSARLVLSKSHRSVYLVKLAFPNPIIQGLGCSSR